MTRAPIRAGLAKTPEGSDFTSIQECIEAMPSGRNRAKPIGASKNNPQKFNPLRTRKRVNPQRVSILN